MKVTVLNFFGIKLINNTGGVDDILGSRMLMVPTRSMPPGTTLPREDRLTDDQCAEIRDSLHFWAFTNVNEIVQAYATQFPNQATRTEEIAAPLRVVAGLTGRAEWLADLEMVIGSSRDLSSVSASELLEEALLTILKGAMSASQQIRSSITVLELQMRLKLLSELNFGKARSTDIADVESPEWIGRQLCHQFAKPGTEPRRLQMYAIGTRAWTPDDGLVDRAAAELGLARSRLSENDDPRAFCESCERCDYQSICAMRAKKHAQGLRSSRPAAGPPNSRALDGGENTAAGTSPRLQ